MRTPTSWMKSSSLCASPGGSTACSRHWSMRWVCVNVPAFSTCEAAGKKNTSVPIVSGLRSPDSISGESCQKVADSISRRSRTTSHLRWARPSRCSRPCAEATAGFCPSRK